MTLADGKNTREMTLADVKNAGNSHPYITMIAEVIIRKYQIKEKVVTCSRPLECFLLQMAR